jgi:transposase-like protein
MTSDDRRPARAIERDVAIVRAYVEDRRAVGQIARTYGISRNLVRAVLARHAIPRDPARRTPRVTVDEPALIRAYRDEHRTLAECAATFGVSIPAVTRVLDRHHIPHGRRPAPIPASTEAAVIRAYRDEKNP